MYSSFSSESSEKAHVPRTGRGSADPPPLPLLQVHPLDDKTLYIVIFALSQRTSYITIRYLCSCLILLILTLLKPYLDSPVQYPVPKDPGLPITKDYMTRKLHNHHKKEHPPFTRLSPALATRSTRYCYWVDLIPRVSRTALSLCTALETR